MEAEKAVIFSSIGNPYQTNETLSEDIYKKYKMNVQEIPDELRPDIKTTVMYRAIRTYNKNIQIMVELVCPKSIELLLSLDELTALSEEQDKATQYEFTPLYASGEIYTPSIIDKITCQSFYNPHIITIIDLILGGNSSSTYYKPQKLDDYIKLTGSNLYLVKAPEQYVNESFSQLFEYLILAYKAVAIGLYRMNLNEGFYYVYTNPNKNTFIKKSDLVFVLADEKHIVDLIDKPDEETNKEGISIFTGDSPSENEEMVNEEEATNNKSGVGVAKERDGNKKDTDVVINEDIKDKLNKLEEMKKEIRMAKHEELDRLRKKNMELKEELIKVKDMLEKFPDFVKSVIDRVYDSELETYLGKKWERLQRNVV